ncbi:hypothetical protein H5410_061667 [Solanum commersonii]|uniref:Uncharacterized protein n=1 Tax=Solanum commersonii TaxID=4109 RepID=A0A9J5W8I2_SOLCO|nr:hypothetical protein H5410_061667 [Solanum commersonii]
MNCDQKNLLFPRCRFDVDLKDNSCSTIGIIMDIEGAKTVVPYCRRNLQKGFGSSTTSNQIIICIILT